MSVQVKGSGTIGGIDEGLNIVGVVTATSFDGNLTEPVGVGLTNPEKTLHVHGNALIEDTIGNNLEIRSTVNNGNDPNFYFSKARGGGTPAIVQNGDDIGNLQWQGYDGNSYEVGASILAEVEGTPSDGDMPMRMTLKTRSAGAGSEQGRIQISADGTVSLVNNSNLSVAGVSTFYNHVTIDTTAAGTSATLTIRGGEGTQGQLRLIADDGDNATDNWRIAAMAGFSNRLIFYNGDPSAGQSDLVSIQTDGTIRPGTTNVSSLGTSSLRWSNVYTNDLHLSNQGSTNSIDNTWGDYTIQEGESDLFLINNRSGKKYKFNLTEVS